jgi:hypothetical protein
MTMNTLTPLAGTVSLRRSRAHIGTDLTADTMDTSQRRIHRFSLSSGNNQDGVGIYSIIMTAYTILPLTTDMEVSLS